MPVIELDFSVSMGVRACLTPNFSVAMSFTLNVSVTVCLTLKAGLYRIWCGVHRLGDTSSFVNPAGQLLIIAINSRLIAEWMASAYYLNSI